MRPYGAILRITAVRGGQFSLPYLFSRRKSLTFHIRSPENKPRPDDKY